jgi:NAD(P)-dependent dehydrogenase (short-subunit alcohol dehydrogenase family)
MPNRLTDKVAIVTGSSSGIGRSIALHYAAEGALLVCADLQPTTRYTSSASETRSATHDHITSSGGRAIFVPVDVSNAAQVEALVQAAVREFGRLDIMVNNAGIGIPSPVPIWDLPVENWDRMQDINCKGVFLGIKYAAKQMLTQDPHPNGDRGWIINAASILGLTGQSEAGEYCAAKGAVVNLTRAAALDCAPQRIHVNAFAPGYAETNMTDGHFRDEKMRGLLEGMHPFRGLGRPEDLARVCVFLASEDAQWVSGVSSRVSEVVDNVGLETERVCRLPYPSMVASGLASFDVVVDWSRCRGQVCLLSRLSMGCVGALTGCFSIIVIVYQIGIEQSWISTFVVQGGSKISSISIKLAQPTCLVARKPIKKEPSS